MALDLRQAHEGEGKNVKETCDVVEVSRATYYRWKTGGAAGALPPGPKGVDPDILATMIDEIRDLRHRKRRTWGTDAIYIAYHRMVPHSVIAEAIRLERMDRNRIERRRAKRYEFAGPDVAWSTDFIKVAGGRILRVDDDGTRLSFGHAFRAEWPDEEVARFVDDGFTRYGTPLAFKHDRGSEFTSVVLQTVLRARQIIALPNPPYYPKANGKQERKNSSVRQWFIPLQGEELGADETFAEVSQALDDNNERPKEILGGLSPREAYAKWPKPSADRAALYAEWDALFEKLLRERFGAGKIEPEQKLEAMRIAALSVLRRHQLVWYGSKAGGPESVT